MDADTELGDLRAEIARIDRELVRLVAARIETARRAIRYRARRGERTTDRSQESVVLRRARVWASEAGLPPRFVEHLLRALIDRGKTGGSGSRRPQAIRREVRRVGSDRGPDRRASTAGPTGPTSRSVGPFPVLPSPHDLGRPADSARRRAASRPSGRPR